jgi:dihydrofolate reductase
VAAPKLTAIAAVADNGVIGDGRGLLWRIPEDFAHFKAVTMGGVLVMGRTTFESMGAPLKGRTSVVVTRRPGAVPAQDPDGPGTAVLPAASPEAALGLLAGFPDRRWWVIGGGQLYRALWDVTTDLDITEVHQSPDASVRFPAIGPADWLETARLPRDGFDFVTYTRRTDAARTRLAAAVHA